MNTLENDKNKTGYSQILKDKRKIADLRSEREVRLADIECSAVILFSPLLYIKSKVVLINDLASPTDTRSYKCSIGVVRKVSTEDVMEGDQVEKAGLKEGSEDAEDEKQGMKLTGRSKQNSYNCSLIND